MSKHKPIKIDKRELHPDNPYAVPARQRRAGAHKDKDEKRRQNKEAKLSREWDDEADGDLDYGDDF